MKSPTITRSKSDLALPFALQACIIAGISGPGLDTHISTLFLCRHVVRDPCRRRPGTAATDIYFSQPGDARDRWRMPSLELEGVKDAWHSPHQGIATCEVFDMRTRTAETWFAPPQQKRQRRLGCGLFIRVHLQFLR